MTMLTTITLTMTIILRGVFCTVDPLAQSLLLCYYSFDHRYYCYFNYPNSIVTAVIVYTAVVITSLMVEGSFTIIC